MKTLNVTLALVALAAAGPALGEELKPTPVTAGSWVVTKPGARVTAPTATAGVPITTGPWLPSKPGARPLDHGAGRTVVTTGRWVPSRSAAPGVARR